MSIYLLGCAIIFTVGLSVLTYKLTTTSHTFDLDAVLGLFILAVFCSWLTIAAATIIGVTYLVTKYIQNKTKDSNE